MGVTDYVASWVDDLVYCSRDEKFDEEFEVALRKTFLVSEVSDLNWFLGKQIRRDANNEISQECYIEKFLEIFGRSDAKTAFTPALGKVPISSVDCPSKGSKEEKEMMCCD